MRFLDNFIKGEIEMIAIKVIAGLIGIIMTLLGIHYGFIFTEWVFRVMFSPHIANWWADIWFVLILYVITVAFWSPIKSLIDWITE
jgi:phosphotransferase system  glucose/maltose/N-acetylglucosamine-specific IIC component